METLAKIKTNLKKLRLISFYENIEQRNLHAIKTKMSYMDFLLLLTQDEIDRRNNRKRELSLKKAKLGKYQRIAEFDFDFNPKINRQEILPLTTCEFIKKK